MVVFHLQDPPILVKIAINKGADHQNKANNIDYIMINCTSFQFIGEISTSLENTCKDRDIMYI